MLVEDAVIGLDAEIIETIERNLPDEARVAETQRQMMISQLINGNKEETLQLGRLMRSLYQQLKGEHNAALTYFGAVTYSGNDKDFVQAIRLAKRVASDCMQDGNRRISCVHYEK